MILAVIFDLDGVMIDSEAIHSQTFEQIVREHGKTPILHKSGVIQEPGLREKENWEQIMAKHKFSEDIGVLTKRRTKTLSDLLKKNAKMQEGLRNLLNSLKRKGIKMAVASSASMQTISLVLDVLKVSHYFDAVVSGDAVVRGKPFPDIFLEAARQLKVAPEKCVVLEDAESGIRAGKAAGMKVIAVPNKYTSCHDFSKADVIVASLHQVTVEKL